MWWTPWLWSLLHRPPRPSAVRASTCSSLRSRLPHGTSCTSVWTTSTLRSLSRIDFGKRVVRRTAPLRARRSPAAAAPALRRRSGGLTSMCPLTCGRERAHHLAQRRREDVDAAHDQHVVGAPDAAHARPGAPARGSRPCAPARGRESGSAAAAPPRWRRCVSTSSPLAPSSRASARPALRVDQLGVHEAARAEVHAVLLLAFAPERRPDVADAHRLGDGRPPALRSSRARNAGSPPPGSPATSTRATLEPARSTPRSAATSSRWAAYDGVTATISGFSSSIALSMAARCCPSPPGCGRARCGRRPPAPRPPRTGPRCRC